MIQKSFLLLLRETAKNTSSEQGRTILRDVSNQLDMALRRLYVLPSVENMQEVNGLWAIAQRTLDTLNKPEGGPHGGALREPAELAA